MSRLSAVPILVALLTALLTGPSPAGASCELCYPQAGDCAAYVNHWCQEGDIGGGPYCIGGYERLCGEMRSLASYDASGIPIPSTAAMVATAGEHVRRRCDDAIVKLSIPAVAGATLRRVSQELVV